MAQHRAEPQADASPARNRGQFTSADAARWGRIGGYTNIARHGRKPSAAHLGPALAGKRREEAIRLGAKTEAEIAERVQDLARLQALKAAAARWGKRNSEDPATGRKARP